MSAQWAVGDEVLCHGKPAVVQFVGETSFASGVWIGVEFLRSPAGRNDGSVAGVQYFGPCKPDHGLFVREGSLTAYNAQEAAAIKLQSQVRRKRDKENVQYAQTFRALSHMECIDESDMLRTNINNASVANILQEEEAEREGGSAGERTVASPLSPMRMSACSAGSQSPPSSSVRPKLEFVKNEDGTAMTVPKACIDQVLAYFKREDAKPLAASCVAQLVRHAADAFRRDVTSAVNDVKLPAPPGRGVIVGDTHGQLEDFLWILFEQGEPSASNMFLVNGDVVDRGSRAIEILVLIMLYKLWCPGCMHFNKGNHEDPCMNESYGFRDECIVKYGAEQGDELYEAFNAMFQMLPLATIVDESVFVIHGGLWRRDFSLAQLRRVDFRRPLPTRPGFGLEVIPFDSVWSDPQDHKGISPNLRGEDIITFGPDVTKRFLKNAKLRLLVRSHQVPESGHGHERFHDDKGITIFSASNYCGECGNLGAVLVMHQGEADQIFEYMAPSLEELQMLESEAQGAQQRIAAQARCGSSHRASRRQSCGKMEADVIRKVQELIVRRKTALFEYWSGVDTSPRGVFRVSAALWREGCQAVLDPGLPWVRIQELLGVADNGEVNYVKFLTRFRVVFDSTIGGRSDRDWERAFWSKIMETLLRADLPLREALAALDNTSDGLVSGVEFGRLVKSCNIRISQMQARALLRSVAAHPSTSGEPGASASRASMWDLLGRLQVSLPVAANKSSLDPEIEQWAVPKLKPLATAVLDDARKRLVPPDSKASEWPVPKLLASWFEDVDTSQTGYLEVKELVQALLKLAPALQRGGCPADIESLQRLVSYCDIVGNGRINYFELLNSLTWEDSLGPDLREDMMETVYAAILFNADSIRRALRRFDPESRGRVKPEDFSTALRAVYAAMSAAGNAESGLGRGEVEQISAHLSVGEDGMVDYQAFLKSFRIVDTSAGPVSPRPMTADSECPVSPTLSPTLSHMSEN